MDVIALHQAGFTNAVAALGTSFTADHARLLSRYTDEVVLIFDADAAGKKGAQRAISLLRETGLRIRLVNVPDGKDPDEFIRKNGADRFKLLLQRAANDVEYRLMELGSKHLLNTSEGKVEYLKQATLMLSELSNPLERDVYVGKLAAELSVSKEALNDQLQYQLKKRQKQRQERQMSEVIKQSEAVQKKVNPDAGSRFRAASAEEAVLGMCLLHPDFLKTLIAVLPPEEMVTPFNRKVYLSLIERQREGKEIELAYLSEEYDIDEMAYITKMVRDARERVSALTEAEVKRYAEIIRYEYRLSALDNPAELTPEQIKQQLESMKHMKK